MSEAGLLAAMLAVQSEAPILLKDHTATVTSEKGKSYKYSYVELKAIVEKIGPLLVKNGLVWSTLPSFLDADTPTLRYELAHAGTGEAKAGEMLLLLSKDDAQGQGSAITYARRYALVAVLNLVADEDDDGAAATAGRSARAEKGGPASEKQIALVRTLMTKNGVKAGEAKVLLKGAGVEVADGESPRDACSRLRWPGVSDLIDMLKGPRPTGESDFSSDASEFVHPPLHPEEHDPFRGSEV